MNFLYKLPSIITLSGVIIFAFVKFYLREQQVSNSLLLFAIGVYPNFLAGLMIPMLFLFRYQFLAVAKIRSFDIRIKFIMLATLMFLIFEEFRPTFGSSKVLDYWDIIFSAVGLTVFYMVYKKLKFHKLNQNDD